MMDPDIDNWTEITNKTGVHTGNIRFEWKHEETGDRIKLQRIGEGSVFRSTGTNYRVMWSPHTKLKWRGEQFEDEWDAYRFVKARMEDHPWTDTSIEYSDEDVSEEPVQARDRLKQSRKDVEDGDDVFLDEPNDSDEQYSLVHKDEMESVLNMLTTVQERAGELEHYDIKRDVAKIQIMLETFMQTEVEEVQNGR